MPNLPLSSLDKYAFKADHILQSAGKGKQRLQQLFRDFGYDVENPQHWCWILLKFADVHFGRVRRGRPLKWDDEARSKLLTDWLSLDRERGPRWTPIFKEGEPAVLLEGNGQLRKQAAMIKDKHALDPLYRHCSVAEIYKNLLIALAERRPPDE